MKRVPLPWILRGVVCGTLVAAFAFTMGRPQTTEPLDCVTFPSLTAALSNADIDPRIERSGTTIRLPSQPTVGTEAFITWPVDVDTSIFLVTKADLSKAGIVVAGSPEDGRYIVVRSVPVFGGIGLFLVSGTVEETLQIMPGLVESVEGVFGIKRTGTTLEAYSGCQLVGEFPLSKNDMLTWSPRFGVELGPGGSIDRIAPR